MQHEPQLCRPQAFYFFAEQMRALDTNQGLLNAAIAIAMHGLRDVDPVSVRSQLQQLAQRVRRRVRGRQPQALLAHLHDVLFEEEHFAGNGQDYYDAYNSYLPTVLETRRGIPITLCLVYKIVADGIGLSVAGINAPGHFLARVHLPDGWMIIDPYSAGGVLTEDEAFHRIEAITGRVVPHLPEYLAPATHSQWISRMLLNLQHVFARTDRHGDSIAMSELQSLLDFSVC
jgi:regulator of sirC expression with transglutaminase-like and TPR domain